MQLVLEGRVDGSRMRGRPRRTWGQDIKDWAKAKHLGEVKRKAEDRVKWRTMVHNHRIDDVT